MKKIGCPLPKPRRNWALFLDVDGTLLDIAPTPPAAAVPPGLAQTLEALDRALDGAVALVSGRAIADLDRLFAPLSLAAAGQHGAEIGRLGGARETLGAPLPDGLRARLESLARTGPGVLIESKGLTLAVHYRLVPDREEEIRRYVEEAVGPARDRIEMLEGRSVIEIKSRGFSKRTAVETLMRDPPFAGRTPIFLGDDRTDEDGFAAVLAQGGCAIRVGLAGDSIADRLIESPARTRAWLADAAAALSQIRT